MKAGSTGRRSCSSAGADRSRGGRLMPGSTSGSRWYVRAGSPRRRPFSPPSAPCTRSRPRCWPSRTGPIWRSVSPTCRPNSPPLAREALDRVRLDGPFSGEALLAAGWAEAADGNYRAALTPWLALQGRDALSTPSVQEADLTVPYAFVELQSARPGGAVLPHRAELVRRGSRRGSTGAIARIRAGESARRAPGPRGRFSRQRHRGQRPAG